MISKNFTKTLSVAIAMLIMAQALGQQGPKETAQTKLPKRMISQVAQKRAIKSRDIIQGSIIGSMLFGSSFFVQDPNLKTALRVLAFAPMVVGFFMPQKFYQKFDKLDLELDEAGCSSTNYMCKGICADCRITKSYLAAIPLTLIPYAIYSFLAKKPTEAAPLAPEGRPATVPVPNPAPIHPVAQNAAPNQVPATPAAQNNQENQPHATAALQNAEQNNANQNQIPTAAPAALVEEQNPAHANIDVVATQPAVEQARPAADAVQVEAQQIPPQANQAPAAQPDADASANHAQQPEAATPAATQNAQSNEQPQRQGWLDWINAGRDRIDAGLARILIGGEESETNTPTAQPAAPANNAHVEDQHSAPTSINAIAANNAAAAEPTTTPASIAQPIEAAAAPHAQSLPPRDAEIQARIVKSTIPERSMPKLIPVPQQVRMIDSNETVIQVDELPKDKEEVSIAQERIPTPRHVQSILAQEAQERVQLMLVQPKLQNTNHTPISVDALPLEEARVPEEMFNQPENSAKQPAILEEIPLEDVAQNAQAEEPQSWGSWFNYLFTADNESSDEADDNNGTYNAEDLV